MKKSILMAIAALLLTSCNNNNDNDRGDNKVAKEVKFKNLPAALADCKTFIVTTVYEVDMVITRCPMSAATVRYGKYGMNTTVDENPGHDEDDVEETKPHRP